MESRLENIWKYLDGEMTPEEANSFVSQLEKDEVLQDLYQNVVDTHNALKSIGTDVPHMGFSSRVMEKIKVLPSPRSSHPFKGLHWLFTIFAAISIVSMVVSIFSLKGGSFNGFEPVTSVTSTLVESISSVQSMGFMIVAVLCLVGFVWLDNFMKSRFLGRNTLTTS